MDAMGYLCHTEEDRARMLEAIGFSSVEDLFTVVSPALALSSLDLPAGLSEPDVRSRLETLAGRNRQADAGCFLGAGYYHHYVPAAVNALVSRTEFATAYTPYQAEVSQGTLQHIFEFQTAVCELTGLDVANASLYDGFSALAEAAFMAVRLTRRSGLAVSAGIHPEAREVIRTYAAGPELALDELPLSAKSGRTEATPPDGGRTDGIAAVLVQQPNFFGVIEDLPALADSAHTVGALLVVMQNPMTFGLLPAAGLLGADIVVGDVQVFGNPMHFGGPSAGYLACRQEHLRQLPGRLVGQTTDLDGRVCYTLTLQAREQHIRRAKATSNICSNQALSALAATIYLALLGPGGLRRLGEICAQRAHYLETALRALPGVSRRFSGPFFHEFALELPMPAGDFVERMGARGIRPGVSLERFPDLPGSNGLLVAVTESNTRPALDRYIAAAREVLGAAGGAEAAGAAVNAPPGAPAGAASEAS